MATPILSRPPTCLSCLRRGIVAPSSSARLGLGPLPLAQQVRGKKTKPPKDRGCVVRLLEDIPQYGRKNAIIRTERARMRNLWFPNKKAEYMTASRFAELRLKRNDGAAIIERDPLFAVARETQEDDLADVLDLDEIIVEPVFKGVPPARAVSLLGKIIPTELAFHRKIILEGAAAPAPAPGTAKSRSPLLADSARVSSEPAPEPSAAAAPTITRIFGSVSADDVAARIRSLCQTAAAAGEADAGLIRVEGRDVRFVLRGAMEGMEEADRVRALGAWEVDVVLRGEGAETEVLKRKVVVAGAE